MGKSPVDYYALNKEAILAQQKERKRLKFEKDIKDNNWIEGPDYIICKICGHKGKDLGTHIKAHGMNSKEYKKVYGEDAPIKCQNMCDRLKGENNPGYQHGGKFSVFSDNFLYADDNGEKKKAAFEKAHNSRVENESYTTTIEYWLKKTNGNLEEAKRLLSERQSTFSLDKCVDKLGKKEGFDRWKERQDKWLESYNDKSYDEMMEINRKKARLNSVLIKDYSNDRGMLYILEIADNFFKIGITTKDLNERYHGESFKVIKTLPSTISHCFYIEQLLKEKFSHYQITSEDKVRSFGWTETFKMDSINTLVEYAESLYESADKTKTIFLEYFKLDEC